MAGLILAALWKFTASPTITDKGLTTAQKIKLIQDSWKSAEPVYGKIIVYFYEQLFEADASIRPLFKNVKMADQSMKVIEAITASVKGLDDVPAVLDILRELGKRHIKYNVTIAHYVAFEVAFTKTLKHFFGVSFQGDLQESWTWLISVICSTMTEPYPKPITTAQKIKLIQDSWKSAEPVYGKIIIFFYDQLFAEDSTIKPLFKNVKMADQSMKVIEAITASVKGLDDVPAVLDSLRELGKRHIKYGVTIAHYGAFDRAFTKTLKHFFGDKFQGELEESWTWLISVICATMTEPYPKPTTTAQKIKLIQDSWLSAEPVYGKIIVYFYDQLFAQDSSIKPLFKNVKMADQSMKVIEAITASVKGLDDVPAVLDSLRELGKRHIKYGVTIAHYGAFDRAFSNTLKHFFGDKFQGDLQEAWTWLISVICSTMTEPYPKPLTTLQKIKIVQDTWAAAEPAYPLIIDYFYEKMFAYDASIEPLFKNVAMKDQKMGVVNAVTGAIKGLNDVPAVLDGLRELGKRHLKYRVTSAHYDAFSSAFLETLAHFMAENYKGDVKESWVWIIGVICATMREAYNK